MSKLRYSKYPLVDDNKVDYQDDIHRSLIDGIHFLKEAGSMCPAEITDMLHQTPKHDRIQTQFNEGAISRAVEIIAVTLQQQEKKLGAQFADLHSDHRA